MDPGAYRAKVRNLILLKIKYERLTPYYYRKVGNKNTTNYVLVGKYTEARLCCQCARKESAY